MSLINVIEKLLQEVDPDIRDVMLQRDDKNEYYHYELLHDPALTILQWQAMRDRKK